MNISSNTLEITFENIQTLIKRAIEIDACQDDILILQSLKTVDEFINHQEAPYWCFGVADNLLYKRLKQAEYIIARDFSCACEYALYIICERWDGVEDNLQNVLENNNIEFPGLCYNYAKFCIRGRWERAEPLIIKSVFFSSYYATDVLKHRWDELDKIIDSYTEEEFRNLEYNDKIAIKYYKDYFNK